MIANRGEIACRIIRTAKKMGIKTVAVFSEADAGQLHVKAADEAYLIGPAASKDSYLNITKIIEVAKKAKVDAIHPGYGFLSENDQFAKACEEESLIFVGPTSNTINLMANKKIAKDIMKQHGVPTLPGYYDETHEVAAMLAAAKQIGFPVLLKAVAGGGGKGLRMVHDPDEFEHAYFAVRREAKAFFNDDKLLIEKYLGEARHIEVQILADHHGQVTALSTRDCSIQRRHQKLVEEAPAPNLPEALQQEILAAGIKAAEAIHYTNAGTIEFLVEKEFFYFLEMNTRLQVEHPVTEMITGLDLVEWQLRIAAGEKFDQGFTCKGHAIEVRLNAEDPDQNFLPQAGELRYIQFPVDQPQSSSMTRVDSGYQTGDSLNIYYDSLIAKLIAWGDNRLVAINRLQQLLTKTELLGIKTNLSLLKRIIADESFKQATFTTQFLTKMPLISPAFAFERALAVSGLFMLNQNLFKQPRVNYQDLHSPWLSHDNWRLFSIEPSQFHLNYEQVLHAITLYKEQQAFAIKVDQRVMHCNFLKINSLLPNVYAIEVIIDNYYLKATLSIHESKLELILDGDNYQLELGSEESENEEQDLTSQVLAPMPGTLVALHVNSGQKVAKGDKLLVIEAMKMEHTLYAPKEGVIKKCYYNIGDLIKEGSELMTFE